jgi:RimJ/RimL family protein N-acetyltransferase
VGVVPYRIETDRLVIRCYDPADAPLLKDAVDRSIDHLRPWMDWTPAEPEPVDAVVDRLRTFRAAFDADENWIMGVFSRDESRCVGGTGLHPRTGADACEVGYWIAVDEIGQGYATEVLAVLTRAGFEASGFDRIDVRVATSNDRSAAIPRKLGFTLEGTLRRTVPRRDQPKEDAFAFSMLREELATSPCMDYAYQAYDVLGHVLGPPAT